MIEQDGLPDTYGAGESHARKRKRSLTEARRHDRCGVTPMDENDVGNAIVNRAVKPHQDLDPGLAEDER